MSSLPDEPAPSFTFAAGNQVGGSCARRPVGGLVDYVE